MQGYEVWRESQDSVSSSIHPMSFAYRHCVLEQEHLSKGSKPPCEYVIQGQLNTEAWKQGPNTASTLPTCHGRDTRSVHHTAGTPLKHQEDAPKWQNSGLSTMHTTVRLWCCFLRAEYSGTVVGGNKVLACLGRVGGSKGRPTESCLATDGVSQCVVACGLPCCANPAGCLDLGLSRGNRARFVMVMKRHSTRYSRYKGK